jgi:hypothetical protein
MGVRFISIQEGIDTIDPQCPALKMLPFYFIFNEWHSATTSEKIRAVFKNLALQGKYCCTEAPYGYEKDPDDKHKLIIDPYAASIVKRIFEMRLEKRSYRAIAITLNADGIASPRGYSAEKRGTANNKPRGNMWSDNTIIRILGNPAYCGDVASNKSSRPNYKCQKQVIQPQENWIVVEDMHEPIVSREDFQKCADMRANMGRVRSTQDKDTRPFTGLLKCPDCGYAMTLFTTYRAIKGMDKKKRIDGYNCGTYARKGTAACAAHYILVKDLKAVVLADIREKAGKVIQNESAARERFYAIKAKSNGSKLNAERAALKKVNARLAELDKLMRAAFEKSVLDGKFSHLFAEYAQNYETEKQDLKKQADKLSASIAKQSQTENDVETFIALMKKYADITDIDRATAVALIDHITVSASAVKPREIVIHYNFIGNIEQKALRL